MTICAEFLTATLRHPLCAVPTALYGKDGRQGIARDLRELGRCRLATGKLLKLPLGETGEALEKRARRTLFLELDRIEREPYLGCARFRGPKVRRKLRYQMDLHDGLGLHRVRKGSPLTSWSRESAERWKLALQPQEEQVPDNLGFRIKWWRTNGPNNPGLPLQERDLEGKESSVS